MPDKKPWAVLVFMVADELQLPAAHADISAPPPTCRAIESARLRSPLLRWCSEWPPHGPGLDGRRDEMKGTSARAAGISCPKRSAVREGA